jgi:sigma-B regulation protein RsbU (phosphoserine phosphatase)
MFRTSRRHTSDRDGLRATVASTARDLCGFRVWGERRGASGARGGDFYTLAVHAPGRIGVVIGDACGSGPEGEAQLAPVLPKVCELARSGVSPAKLLTELNRIVALELPIDKFVTAVALELDVKNGALIAANAAHVPPLVRRGSAVSIVCRHAGAPLGFSEASTYVDETHTLAPRDVIVLMTDGVLEAIECDLLAMSTSRTLFREAAHGAPGVHRRFLRKLEECAGRRPADDMTLLAVEALSDAAASNANGFLEVG